MKTVAEVSAILTVLEPNPGQYVLRIGDVKYRALVVSVSKLLPDASSLIVVTPNDVKVFQVEGNHGEGDTESSQGSGMDVEETGEIDPEMQAAIDEQNGHAAPGQGSEPEEVTPKVVRRKRSPSSAGSPSPCGRCRGSGKISVILEGGKGAEAPCGVCGGSGSVTRYGERR